MNHEETAIKIRNFNSKVKLISYAWILFIASVIAIFGSYILAKELDCKYNGELISGEVIAASDYCVKNRSKIKVLYNNKVHIIPIKISDCKSGVFKRGEMHQFLYSKRFNALLRPDINVLLKTVVLFLCFCFLYFFLIKFRNLRRNN